MIKLTLTPDQSHLVAVTGEDKCIRVFMVAEDGALAQLSQRCMPKRPCAILVTPDNSTILCGDKFGDVYSLPLEYRELPQETVTSNASPAPAASERVYNPSATNLTVHTARNRKALEEQLRRKGQSSNVKEPLKFEHQLLLGHVSMLTDMQLATAKVNGKSRHHIITSDRDEHIRISRGPPQAHIIERFCLGHKDFISYLQIVPKSNLLVSGGGDDWIGVWDWTTGQLVAKHDLRKPMEEALKGNQGNAPKTNVAVSGMWVVPGGHGGQDELLVIALEGVDSYFLFDTATLKDKKCRLSTIGIEGDAILDIASTADGHLILSSDPKESGSDRLLTLKVSSVGSSPVVESTRHGAAIKTLNAIDVPAPDRKALDTLLYGVERLRKRGDEDGMENE